MIKCGLVTAEYSVGRVEAGEVEVILKRGYRVDQPRQGLGSHIAESPLALQSSNDD